jgi:hypothetical protein
VDTPPDGPEVLCASDDFHHHAITARLWPTTYQTPPAMITDNGSQLFVALGTSTTAAYSGVQTKSYNFGDMRTVIEVDNVPGANGATVEIAWRSTTNSDRLHMYVDGATLYFGQVTTTGPDDLGAPYDPIAMKFWQLRHDLSAVDVAFDTSADGQTWTTLRRIYPAISLSSVYIEIQAGTYKSVATPGFAALDNFAMIGICN